MDVTDALARVTAALPGGGEQRDGQVAMAEAVAGAIEGSRHLVAQAGTGTGKSMAYLVPAALSGRKVVVATATKALQDQLAGKDLPFLQQHLGVPFTFSVLKGRSNYLCRQRAAEVVEGDEQLSLDDAPEAGGLGKEVLRLVEWGRTTESGDRADLPFEPRPRAWAAVSVSAMECPGVARCPSGEVCLAEHARKRAEMSDIVVTNTHLYGAHLASGGHVLPDHDVVVFDEAHQLEDIAATSLGFELGGGRFSALARTMRSLTGEAVATGVAEAGTLLQQAAAAFAGMRLPAGLGDLAGVVALADSRVAAATQAVRDANGDQARTARALQAAGHLRGDLAMLASLPDTHVGWVEGTAYEPVIKVAAVDVGARLHETLWQARTAILTSATLPAAVTAQLGFEAGTVDEVDVGSPFPYEQHALLYCAAHLPDPRNERYQAALIEELGLLIAAAGGRTLALFTSWRMMRAAAEALAGELPGPLLSQSDLPKPALVAAFLEDETASLFATMGFWQGIDVPGRSLSLVTIDRIPFPRPDEPLMQARRDRAGAAAFRLVDIPRAATMLAQGAGRLIRSSEDRGVVAVLDPRLASASYRWDLVRALPPMRRTRDRDVVLAFLHELTAPTS